MSQIVTVKMQRPIMSNGSMHEVMSYIVNDDGDQASNPVIEEMPLEDVKLIFGDYYKVYFLGEYTEGKPTEIFIKNPVRKEDWV